MRGFSWCLVFRYKVSWMWIVLGGYFQVGPVGKMGFMMKLHKAGGLDRAGWARLDRTGQGWTGLGRLGKVGQGCAGLVRTGQSWAGEDKAEQG